MENTEYSNVEYQNQLKKKLKEVENSENGFDAYMLSRELTDPADIKTCEDIIINEGDPRIILSFGLECPTCNKLRCLRSLVTNHDMEGARLLIHGAGIPLHEATAELKRIKMELNDEDILSLLL